MEGPKELNKKTENGPNIKIVGGASPKNKERIKQWATRFFSEGHLSNLSKEQREALKRLEYPKSDEELLLIGFADEKVSELMEKSGVRSYGVPPQNLHILPTEFYADFIKGAKNAHACTDQRYQIVIFDANSTRGDNFYFSILAFHELMHLKSYFTYEVNEKEYEKGEGIFELKTTRSPFRMGITVESSLKRKESGMGHEHFRGLNEALVGYFEKDYIQKMLSLPLFKEEKEWLESVHAMDLKQKLSEHKNIDIGDIAWVSENGDEARYITFSYPEQRKVFDLLISEIQKKFSKKYDNPDKVALEFLKSMFNGDFRNIAELVNKTFGDLSFRVLGMMNEDKNSAINCLEYLRAALRNKKSKERGQYNKEKDEKELSTGV